MDFWFFMFPRRGDDGGGALGGRQGGYAAAHLVDATSCASTPSSFSMRRLLICEREERGERGRVCFSFRREAFWGKKNKKKLKKNRVVALQSFVLSRSSGMETHLKANFAVGVDHGPQALCGTPDPHLETQTTNAGLCLIVVRGDVTIVWFFFLASSNTGDVHKYHGYKL